MSLIEVAAYPGSSDELRTQVGNRLGSALCSTATEGFLVYGPYINLERGAFVFKVFGKLQILGELRVEIVADHGVKTLSHQTTFDFDGHKLPDNMCLISHQTILCDREYDNVELRVYIDSFCKLSIDLIEIHRVLTDDFAMVNVSHKKDLEWSGLLLQTWDKFVSIKTACYVIVPKKQVELFNLFFYKFYVQKKISSIPFVLNEESVFMFAGICIPENLSGWLIQQLLKLCFSKLDLSKDYITIDSATIFTKQFIWTDELYKGGRIVTSARLCDRKERNEYFLSVGEMGWLSGKEVNISESFEVIEKLFGNTSNLVYHNIGETNFFCSEILLEIESWAYVNNIQGFLGLIELVPLEPTWYGSFVANKKKEYFFPRDPDLTVPIRTQDEFEMLIKDEIIVGDGYYGVRFQPPIVDILNANQIYALLCLSFLV